LVENGKNLEKSGKILKNSKNRQKNRSCVVFQASMGTSTARIVNMGLNCRYIVIIPQTFYNCHVCPIKSTFLVLHLTFHLWFWYIMLNSLPLFSDEKTMVLSAQRVACVVRKVPLYS